MFIRHYRGKDVDEAIDTNHVAPAGAFQPSIDSDEDDVKGLNSRFWELDFSICKNVIREFLEECRNMERAIKQATKDGNDWASIGAAANPYKSLRNAVKSGNDAKLFYLGVGFDPLTEKPELLTALIMHSDLAGKLEFNYEGKGHEETVFSTSNLKRLMDSDERWLSAGSACLQLALKHHDRLISCLS